MDPEPDRLRVDIDLARRTMRVSIIQPGLVASIDLSHDNAIWFVQSMLDAIAYLNGSAVPTSPN